jgi:S-adenosylmethionine hydrolase
LNFNKAFGIIFETYLINLAAKDKHRNMKRMYSITVALFILMQPVFPQNGIVVIQTDFGLKDGAVSAMKGVAMQVSPALKLYDLTHEIPSYNIWEAAYRLEQTAQYWPKGTVFVSVVDPGVGSNRKSVVLKTKTGHFFVSPDNGTLTLIAKSMGIDELREIDEKINRLPGSGESYTFHGRDVYAYTASRLAAGKITYQQVGPKLSNQVVSIDYQAAVIENGVIKGNIPILDVQYGNVWTNIPEKIIKQLNIHRGDTVSIEVFEKNISKYSGRMPFVATFTSVADQQPLCYLNSLLNFSFALNMGDFAKKYSIASGPDWMVVIQKIK